VADPGGWGCIPTGVPQCTETGHFEVQNGEKQFWGGAQTPPQTLHGGEGIPHTLTHSWCERRIMVVI